MENVTEWKAKELWKFWHIQLLILIVLIDYFWRSYSVVLFFFKYKHNIHMSQANIVITVTIATIMKCDYA